MRVPQRFRRRWKSSYLSRRCQASISPRLLKAIDRLLIVGSNQRETLNMFCRARGLRDLTAPEGLERGQILSIDVKAQSLKRLNVIPGTGQRLRHRRKYAEGTLGEDNSFWFRGPAGKLNLRHRT
jgi:hypothetical protein